MSKGQVTDSLLPFVNLFVFFIVILILATLATALADAFPVSTYGIMGTILTAFKNSVFVTDYTVPFGFGLLVVLQFVSGYKVPTRSFFLVINLIVFILSILVAALLNNAFDLVITQLSGLGTANFPITLFLFDHMFEYYIILGFAWLFGFYVKDPSPNENSVGGSYFG